jgi:hypothetical protein
MAALLKTKSGECGPLPTDAFYHAGDSCMNVAAMKGYVQYLKKTK